MAIWTNDNQFSNIRGTTVASDSIKTDNIPRVYLMEEASGTVMTDVGSEYTDGVRDAALTQVAGAFGGRFATKGDGTNYNTIPWSSDFRDDFTWRMRIKPTAADLAGTYTGVFGGWSPSRSIFLYIDSGLIGVAYSTSGSSNSQSLVGSALSEDTWYEIQFTYGATNGATLSVDGVSKDTEAYTSALYDFNAPLKILSAGNTASSTEFNGAICDVRFYPEEKPATYAPDTDYYNPSGEALIHDAGETYQDSALTQAWDNSTAEANTSFGTTAVYQYADYATDQSFADAAEVEAGATWNGTWLTLAELKIEMDTGNRYRYFKTKIIQVHVDGTFDDFSCDSYDADVTPPNVPTTTKFALFETDNYVMIWVDPDDSDFSHCELRAVIDTVDTFLAKNGLSLPEWQASPSTYWTFAEDDITKDSVVSNWVYEDLVGTDVMLYVRSVDTNGNKSAWEAFTPGSGGDAPTPPDLAVVDEEDGTVTYTVSGADAGTANKVYTIPVVGKDKTLRATIAANGSDTSALAAGAYWAVVESTGTGGITVGEMVYFRATDGTISEFWQVMDAVAAKINAEGLKDSGGDTVEAVVEVPPKGVGLATSQIKVFSERDEMEPDHSQLNSAVYRVNVAYLEESTDEAQVSQAFVVREQIQDMFLGSRLAGYTICYCINAESPNAVDDFELDKKGYTHSLITLSFTKLRNKG